MRLFVAAELPDELRGRFARAQEALRKVPLPVRWVPPDGMHLTLKFLGEAAESRLAEIETAVGAARREVGTFRLEAVGVTVFPGRGTPRLVWVEVRGDVAAARRLATAIDVATARIGFPPETRDYRPHLTLGRVKGPGQGDWREALAQGSGSVAGGFEVTEYVLFQSRLGREGAVHTALERFKLAPGPESGGMS